MVDLNLRLSYLDFLYFIFFSIFIKSCHYFHVKTYDKGTKWQNDKENLFISIITNTYYILKIATHVYKKNIWEVKINSLNKCETRFLRFLQFLRFLRTSIGSCTSLYSDDDLVKRVENISKKITLLFYYWSIYLILIKWDYSVWLLFCIKSLANSLQKRKIIPL